ncbi:hypothetical protein QNO09_38630 [Streptomyces sp. 378]|uniref:hypothetical protein n=1 Tax=Streptomyces sp. 378 TaxID=3049412 RepID=UPI0024C33CC5|nr:hypothetical protein [Streptomyces sp. 378]MDK1349067.1 hypothetical protein [Streptomyces sp. 378]
MTAEHFRGRSSPPDPNTATLQAMTKDGRSNWDEALLGNRRHHTEVTLLDGRNFSYDKNSCVQKAQREVYGAEWSVLFQSFQGFANRVMQETMDSALAEEARRQWAHCMREAGHRYKDAQDPRRAVQALLDRADGDPARLRITGRKELLIARKDSDCERKVRLHEAVLNAQATVEKRVLAGHEVAYRRLVELRRQALARLSR